MACRRRSRTCLVCFETKINWKRIEVWVSYLDVSSSLVQFANRLGDCFWQSKLIVEANSRYTSLYNCWFARFSKFSLATITFHLFESFSIRLTQPSETASFKLEKAWKATSCWASFLNRRRLSIFIFHVESTLWIFRFWWVFYKI